MATKQENSPQRSERPVQGSSSSGQLSSADAVLDLLLEALERRREEREAEMSSERLPAPPTDLRQVSLDVDAEVIEEPGETDGEPSASGAGLIVEAEQGAIEHQEADQPAMPPLTTVHLGRTLFRLLLVVALLVVLVNIPVTRYGTSLARIMPDSASLVIRDGLVLKGSGPDIYVLEDNKLRWITSLEAFEFFGYRWTQVHVVEDSFLQHFELGRPIHVLLKCPGSPHIYALESGQKRWVRDIATFEAQGYVWEDVKSVDCSYLRRLPDGPTIPADVGSPPQP